MQLKKIIFKTVLPLVIILLSSFFYLARSNNILLDKYSSEEKFILDSVVNIKLPKQQKGFINPAFAELRRIEYLGDVHKKDSEMSMINDILANIKPTAKINISKDMSNILKKSFYYSKLTDGKFDITIGNLINLWGIGKKNYLPEQSEINMTKKTGNYNDVKLIDNNLIISKKGFLFDLGAVLKGYAVDKATDVLKKNGVESALISTVSSTRTIGLKNNSQLWKIGIENPRDKNKKIIGILKIGSNVSVSTSGDYQRYFIRKGRRYAHILDPISGFPSNKCISSTVVSNLPAADTDILSTAIFVMGYPEGINFVEKLSGVEALMIDKSGIIHLSSGMQKYVEKIDKSIY